MAGEITAGDLVAVMRFRDEFSAQVRAATQMSVQDFGTLQQSVLLAKNEVRDLQNVIVSLPAGSPAAQQMATELGTASIKAQVLSAQLKEVTSSLGASAVPQETAASNWSMMAVQSMTAANALKQARMATDEHTDAAQRNVLALDTQSNMVTRLIERYLVYASIRGVLSAVETTIHYGLEIEKLSQQLGVGTDAVQTFMYASVQTAVPMGSLTAAITQMQRKVGEEDGGLMQALNRLHIPFETLRALAPEAQFDLIASKISQVKDQTDFAADAAQIFNSRSGTSIAAVLLQWDDLKAKAADANVILTHDQVDDLATVAKAWDVIIMKAKAYFASLIVAGYNTSHAHASDPKNVFAPSYGIDYSGKTSGLSDATILAQQIAKLAADIKVPAADIANTLSPENIGLDKLGKAAQKDLDDVAKQLTKTADESIRLHLQQQKAADDFRDALARVMIAEGGYGDLLSKVDGTTLQLIRDGLAHGASVSDLAKVYKPLNADLQVNEEVVKQVAEQLKAENAVIAETNRLMLAHPIAVREGTAALVGFQNVLNGLTQDGLLPATITTGQFNDHLTLLQNMGHESAQTFDQARVPTVGWTKDLGQLDSAFSHLATVSSGSMQTVVKDIATLVGAMDVAQKSIDTFYKGQKDGSKTEEALGLVGTASSFLQATSGGGIQGVAGGALVGAQIGVAFGGQFGAAAGAAIGGLTGLFRSMFGDHTASDIASFGQQWGVTLSASLQKTIVDQTSSMFHGSEGAAMLNNLSAIITGAGGLNASNLDQWTAKLHDVFSFIGRDQMTIAQGATIIDQNWQAFVTAGTDGDGRLSDSLKTIIALNQQFGTDSKQIAAYITTETTTAATGFASVAVALQGDQSSLDAVGRTAVTTYAAMIAAGSTPAAALKAVGPGLDALVATYKTLGLAIKDVGLKSLLMQEQINTANPTLMAGISGLSSSMIALDNVGLMNVGTFGDMEKAGSAMYVRVQAQVHTLGGTTADALGQMQSYLHQAAKEAALLGVPLDANTQMLIDQSQALGIWQATGLSATDKLTASMTTLVDKVSQLIDQLSGKGGVTDAIAGIGSAASKNPFQNWKMPDLTDPSGHVGPAPVGMAEGGYGRAMGPALFYTAGNEDFAFSGEGKSFGGSASGGGVSGTIVIPVNLDGRTITEVIVPLMPAEWRRLGLVA